MAEAAREDVNLLHIPESWCCYRTVPLHLPHPHHQCVSASRSDFSCLYPYFAYSCSQETCTRDWLTLGGTYTPWYGKEPKDFQSLLVNNRCRPTELSKTLIQKNKIKIKIKESQYHKTLLYNDIVIPCWAGRHLQDFGSLSFLPNTPSYYLNIISAGRGD